VRQNGSPSSLASEYRNSYLPGFVHSVRRENQKLIVNSRAAEKPSSLNVM
jgi:hypothetical protein